MCEIYDQIEGQGIKKGIQQERVNTERERKRAEEAEKELERLKKILDENHITV